MVQSLVKEKLSPTYSSVKADMATTRRQNKPNTVQQQFQISKKCNINLKFLLNFWLAQAYLCLCPPCVCHTKQGTTTMLKPNQQSNTWGYNREHTNENI